MIGRVCCVPKKLFYAVGITGVEGGGREVVLGEGTDYPVLQLPIKPIRKCFKNKKRFLINVYCVGDIGKAT